MSSLRDIDMANWRRSILFAVAVLVAGTAWALGVWQVQRLRARRARNAVALAQQQLPPVDLSRISLSGDPSYRRVVAQGEYDAEHDLVLRGRLYQGVPGAQVVTPLRIAGQDSAVLVNRGFIPGADGVRAQAGIDYRETGPQRLHGIALPIPDQGDGAPVTFHGVESWGRLDLSALRARLPYPIRSYIVLAAPDVGSPDHTLQGRSYPIRIERPPLDNGPHLSYAIQWFFIGGLVLGFGVIFVLRA